MASVIVWHCTEAAKLGEGAVNLAVEHVLVTDDFEQGVAVGECGGEGATYAAKGVVALGGVEFGAEGADFFLKVVDNLRQRFANDVQAGRGLDAKEIEAVDLGEVVCLTPSATGRHNGLYYGVLVDRPAELSAHLFRCGIDSETSEYLNCADLELYRDHYVDCPVAREVQSRILRLPNYPSLTRRDVRRIGDAIRGFYTSG